MLVKVLPRPAVHPDGEDAPAFPHSVSQSHSPCSFSLSVPLVSGIVLGCSCHGAPRHRNQDPALHRLDERNRLMHRLAPALDAPALLASDFTLFEIGKLPQVVYRVELSNLHEPGAHPLHDFAACLEPAPPVGL